MGKRIGLYNESPIDIEIDAEVADMLTSLFNNIYKPQKSSKPKSKKDDVVIIKDIRPREAIAYNKKNETKFKPLYIPKLKRVQFSPPATIAWFEDGSKSVAVAGHGDEYDKETGLAICMLKRVLGNKEYRRIMDEHCYVNKEMLS